MTHTYIIDGITCNGCVTTVKSKLLHNPDITAADISLENRNALLTMSRHLSVDELQETIGRESSYRIRDDDRVAEQRPKSAGAPSTADGWFITYKPLLIIGAFITGVAILTSKNIHTGMNHFMAGFFLVFSFFKLLDLKGFASSYAMYDIMAKKILAWGWIYPFIEAGLGLAFLTGFQPRITLWATVVIMGASSIGVIQSVARKQAIHCACLGAVFNLPMSTVTIVEDLLMVAMAAVMLV